ncbi:hypothetical protein [Candidatus Oscillochloris fontis]|uniref:hypothetical protein n=1 Tax=Candidatus Oscillochloris fontis TaxID=2496868 RepID=UPI00101C26FB|nr:hypothetical protein [Candidatus Oscillochloris fontis]
MKTIADLTSDRVYYRDLEPCDPELPGLKSLRHQLGIREGKLPRKREADYARVALALAQAAQAKRGGDPLTALVVIGDTENDRLLAEFLSQLPGAPTTYGFIGMDRPVAPEILEWHGSIASATRWSLLHPWAEDLEQQGINWSQTALLIDIDKTLLGPRGRGDGAIDDARAEGALVVAEQFLGADMNIPLFRRAYADLCHQEWHHFTLDNQDYVTSTALLIASGVLEYDQLDADVAAEKIMSFAHLLDIVTPHVPASLATLYTELRTRVAAGDPTPFKQFRRAEFVSTISRMADGRLCLCKDLFNLCERLRLAGALCLATSDKPAESALPTPEQAAAGILPLHRTPARMI